MLTDIEIAQNAKMKDINAIAASLGISSEEIDPYGHYKAKISDSVMERLKDKKDGKLILVTAVNPTPAGEGKTTVSIGLGEAMSQIGKKAIIALREPSLGPVFGIKGGAAGGGYSQVVPMEDINLHFTGDMHAITSANNLMCAMLDNSIQQGNELNIDPRRIQVKRCLDMNDRALRNIINSLGGKLNGIPREDHFCITVASEVMAILCLASDLFDLRERLGNILVAYTFDGQPVYCKDIKANGAMTVLLKEAIKPNLVQTLENTPAIMHGGPFANIAHGCNSVRATKTALKLADYTITEAGFGSDLGAEKLSAQKRRPRRQHGAGRHDRGRRRTFPEGNFGYPENAPSRGDPRGRDHAPVCRTGRSSAPVPQRLRRPGLPEHRPADHRQAHSPDAAAIARSGPDTRYLYAAPAARRKKGITICTSL